MADTSVDSSRTSPRSPCTSPPSLSILLTSLDSRLPISESSLDSSPPISELSLDSSAPISELSLDSSAPISELSLDSSRPISELNLDSRRPISELNLDSSRDSTLLTLSLMFLWAMLALRHRPIPTPKIAMRMVTTDPNPNKGTHCTHWFSIIRPSRLTLWLTVFLPRNCRIPTASRSIAILHFYRGPRSINPWDVVRPAGFEPAAYSSGGCRSIHLSYGRMGWRDCNWPAGPASRPQSSRSPVL